MGDIDMPITTCDNTTHAVMGQKAIIGEFEVFEGRFTFGREDTKPSEENLPDTSIIGTRDKT